ncbi:MAG: DUF1499 domain-containing protein [Planctomycetota bacterium]|nr:MAG: DUF1499 domain-containing protein [Planctomycetota bacterium]
MWWLILLLIPLGWAVLALPSWRRPELGLLDGQLRRCPASPNCVCSEGESNGHAIEPLRFSDPPDAAWSRLIAVIEATPNARIITRENDYLRAEFVTPLMRYVDDVEFRLTPAVIHVRSASRVGHSDLGANRSRVEKLRTEFEQAPKQP